MADALVSIKPPAKEQPVVGPLRVILDYIEAPTPALWGIVDLALETTDLCDPGSSHADALFLRHLRTYMKEQLGSSEASTNAVLLLLRACGAAITGSVCLYVWTAMFDDASNKFHSWPPRDIDLIVSEENQSALIAGLAALGAKTKNVVRGDLYDQQLPFSMGLISSNTQMVIGDQQSRYMFDIMAYKSTARLLYEGRVAELARSTAFPRTAKPAQTLPRWNREDDGPCSLTNAYRVVHELFDLECLVCVSDGTRVISRREDVFLMRSACYAGHHTLPPTIETPQCARAFLRLLKYKFRGAKLPEIPRFATIFSDHALPQNKVQGDLISEVPDSNLDLATLPAWTSIWKDEPLLSQKLISALAEHGVLFDIRYKGTDFVQRVRTIAVAPHEHTPLSRKKVAVGLERCMVIFRVSGTGLNAPVPAKEDFSLLSR